MYNAFAKFIYAFGKLKFGQLQTLQWNNNIILFVYRPFKRIC